MAHKAMRSYFRQPKRAKRKTVQKIVVCQRGGARSRRIMRAHYTRYKRAWRLRQRVTLGIFHSTSYGPPWGGINGGGITATGVNLRGAPARYLIAVDPSVIALHSRVYVWPNPFRWRGAFEAKDTGGAIKGNRIDFYDWRGRGAQLGWGRRSVRVQAPRD